MKITVSNISIIEDEKERAEVVDVLEEKNAYFIELFGRRSIVAEIAVRFRRNRFYSTQITLRIGNAPIIVEAEGRKTPAAITRHAYKNLQRVVRRELAKNKPRYR